MRSIVIHSLIQRHYRNLNHNELASLPVIPSAVDYETNLNKFYINDNKLTGFPENIGTVMGKLNHLSARGNRISSLPESIGELRSLTYLYDKKTLKHTHSIMMMIQFLEISRITRYQSFQSPLLISPIFRRCKYQLCDTLIQSVLF